MSQWQPYIKTAETEMRNYIYGEDLAGVTVTDDDIAETQNPAGPHGKIARDPANHKDQWYIRHAFLKNYKRAGN